MKIMIKESLIEVLIFLFYKRNTFIKSFILNISDKFYLKEFISILKFQFKRLSNLKSKFKILKFDKNHIF